MDIINGLHTLCVSGASGKEVHKAGVEVSLCKENEKTGHFNFFMLYVILYSWYLWAYLFELWIYE